MKRFAVISLLALFLGGTGCLKNNNKCGYTTSNVIAPGTEQASLEDSLAEYSIEGVTKAPSGFYYKINTPGTTTSIKDLCTVVAVNYKGSFFNGNGFDSTTTEPAVFQLGQVIDGWQKAIPLIGTGGSIDIYLPPSLGYGASERKDRDGNVVIPANSFLVFHIELVGVG